MIRDSAAAVVFVSRARCVLPWVLHAMTCTPLLHFAVKAQVLHVRGGVPQSRYV